jgi:predicted DNA binding protein
VPVPPCSTASRVARVRVRQRWWSLCASIRNPQAGVEALPKLLVKASSASRPRERQNSRQTQVRLGPREVEALKVAYSEGMRIAELAKMFGIHRTTVTAVLRRSGVQSYGLEQLI